METTNLENKLIAILKYEDIRISKKGHICLNDFVRNIIGSKNPKLYIKRIPNKIVIDDDYYIKLSDCLKILKQCNFTICRQIIQFIEKDENDQRSIIDPKKNIFQYKGHKFLAFFINEDNNDFWIQGADISKFLGYSDFDYPIREYVKSQNKMSFLKLIKLLNQGNSFKYNIDKKSIFINYDGLLQLVAYSKKSKSIDFAKFLGLQTIHKKTYHEQEIINDLIKFFDVTDNKYSAPFFVYGHGGKTYLIDCYLPKYKIAIEIDEHDHNDRDPIYEKQRESYLIKKLDCVFVRCNPNDPSYSTSELIGRIHNLILEQI
jgi:hypothetical protein